MRNWRRPEFASGVHLGASGLVYGLVTYIWLRAVPSGAGELAKFEHSIGLNIRPRLNHGK
jgi:hypothetical protein